MAFLRGQRRATCACASPPCLTAPIDALKRSWGCTDVISVLPGGSFRDEMPRMIFVIVDQSSTDQLRG